jgi:hypothetical protein
MYSTTARATRPWFHAASLKSENEPRLRCDFGEDDFTLSGGERMFPVVIEEFAHRSSPLLQLKRFAWLNHSSVSAIVSAQIRLRGSSAWTSSGRRS